MWRWKQWENGRISAHTGHINKTRVPKEAQDDALSNGTTGDRQTSTGRPTRGDVVRMTVFLVFVRCGPPLSFFGKKIFLS
jgi:hypothetical protein